MSFYILKYHSFYFNDTRRNVLKYRETQKSKLKPLEHSLDE